MNLKKIVFSLMILGLSPSIGLASVKPIYGDFKTLPADCNNLKESGYTHDIDFALTERERLAKEAESLINGEGQGAPKQLACQRYLKAIQTVEGNLKNKLKAARHPTNGNAEMIGDVAVTAGIRFLSPTCYTAMKKKSSELNGKEAYLRQLCKQ